MSHTTVFSLIVILFNLIFIDIESLSPKFLSPINYFHYGDYLSVTYISLSYSITVILLLTVSFIPHQKLSLSLSHYDYYFVIISVNSQSSFCCRSMCWYWCYWCYWWYLIIVVVDYYFVVWPSSIYYSTLTTPICFPLHVLSPTNTLLTPNS